MGALKPRGDGQGRRQLTVVCVGFSPRGAGASPSPCLHARRPGGLGTFRAKSPVPREGERGAGSGTRGWSSPRATSIPCAGRGLPPSFPNKENATPGIERQFKGERETRQGCFRRWEKGCSTPAKPFGGRAERLGVRNRSTELLSSSPHKSLSENGARRSEVWFGTAGVSRQIVPCREAARRGRGKRLPACPGLTGILEAGIADRGML